MILRALLHLTLATCRRYAREERVLRSVVWPIFLTPVTLVATLAFLTAARSPDPTVAVPDVNTPLAADLAEAGFLPVAVPHPRDAIDQGQTVIATDGEVVWTSAHNDITLRLESAVRTHRGSGWVLVFQRTPPDEQVLRTMGGLTLRPLAMLFVLYALVFSLGAISRDRDAEILDVELSLPLPGWGPVFARWVAAVLLLVPAHGLSVGLMQVIMPASDPVQFLLRGTGAIATAAAVGIAVAGGAGRRQGFSGPFAVGSILVAGAFTAGPLIPWARDVLPVFNVFTDAPGLSSLLIGLASGPVGAWLHTWREGRVR